VPKSIAFSFGRFNPPTIGHEKLMDNTRRANRNYRIYASQTQDPKKNPLSFGTKVAVMRSMFPSHARSISRTKVTTAIDVMVQLHKEKYTDVNMIVGSDRVDEFDKLLKKYNGKKARHGYYKFKSIRVISAGERDPDAEGVSGMSASKMRKAAQDNDYKSFQKGLPTKYRGGKLLFNTLRKEMGIKSFNEWAEIEEKPGESTKNMLSRIAGQKLFKREYEMAAMMYHRLIRQKEKSGVALGKAAGTYKHVTIRGLQDYLSNK